MEPHRNFGGADSQSWYAGDDWDSGRHGQARPPAPEQGVPGYSNQEPGTGRFAEPDPRFGDAEPSLGMRLRDPDPLLPRGATIGPRSGEPIPPLVDRAGAISGEIHDTGRRPMEQIDVTALRREPPPPPVDHGVHAHTPPPIPVGAGGGTFSGPTGEYRPSGGSDYGYGGAPAPDYESSPIPGFGAQPAGTTYGGSPVNSVGGPTAEVGVYSGRRSSTGVAIVVAVAVLLFEVPALRVLFASAFSDTVIVTGTVAGTFLVAGLPAFGYGVYGLLAGGGPTPTTRAAWLRAPLVYLPVGLTLLLCAALAAS